MQAGHPGSPDFADVVDRFCLLQPPSRMFPLEGPDMSPDLKTNHIGQTFAESTTPNPSSSNVRYPPSLPAFSNTQADREALQQAMTHVSRKHAFDWDMPSNIGMITDGFKALVTAAFQRMGESQAV